MRQVGSMMKRFGSHASIIVDEQGRFWWFFHPPAMDLESARQHYHGGGCGHGPFESVEPAENNFRDTILGGHEPGSDRSSVIQRRKGR